MESISAVCPPEPRMIIRWVGAVWAIGGDLFCGGRGRMEGTMVRRRSCRDLVSGLLGLGRDRPYEEGAAYQKDQGKEEVIDIWSSHGERELICGLF